MKGLIICTVLLAALELGLCYPYPQQQPVALPPHLLREYLARQQERQRQETPIYEQEAPSNQQVYSPAQAQQIRNSAVQQLVQRQPQPQQNYPQQYLAQQQQPQQIQYVSQAQAQPQQQVYRAPKPQAARPRPLQQQSLEQGELPEDYDPNPSYQFGFDVNDDQFTNYQNRQEQREGNVIKGSYSVVDSDGFIRTVTYTADPKEGFKAEVVRKPTDIVVKIPTPAPHTESHGPLRHQQLQHQHQPQQQQQQHQQLPQQYYRYQQEE